MKTLQLISTAIIISLTTVSFAHNDESESKTLGLQIIEITTPSCNGGENGTATVLGTGGTAPYDYVWNTFPNQTSAKASKLSKGLYFVQVTDAKGEIYFESINIVDPTRSGITERTTSLDEITASIGGMNAPYNFELNGESTNNVDINKLKIGIHQLKITDINDCEMIQFIQVFQVQNELSSLKGESERIKSKKERALEATKLIPTIITTNDNRIFDENLVIVSDY